MVNVGFVGLWWLHPANYPGLRWFHWFAMVTIVTMLTVVKLVVLDYFISLIYVGRAPCPCVTVHEANE